jgi:glutathione S-transferase
MDTLYYSPGAASLAVHQLLIELGAPFELEFVDLEKGDQKGAAYLAINPLGVVPALKSDGEVRTEAAALLLWLAERRGTLVPAPGSPDRGAFLQWTFYLANTVQPLFRRWFYPADVGGTAIEAEVKDGARRGLEAAFDLLDRRLAETGAFMAGPDYTVLDMLAGMLCRWSRNMPKPANRWPHIAAYLDKVTARPSFIEAHRREGLEIWPPRA